MLQVDFKKLAIKHFLSIGEEELVVDFTVGLNVITGKNYDKPDRTNGVGKSTVADALHWVLFGSTIRELDKDSIGNNVTEGKCEGVLLFDVAFGKQVDSYKITRTLSPGKCTLFKNGEDVTRSGMPQTNELIRDIIKSSPELFQNSVIMTVNNTTPFMAQKKIAKRQFVESILNLGAFGEMLKAARTEYNESKQVFDVESAKSAELTRSVGLMQAQKATFEAEKQKRIATINSQIETHEKDINELIPKIMVINTEEETGVKNSIALLKSKLPEIDTAIERLQKDKTVAELSISNYKAELKKLDAKKGMCSFCNKDIDGLLAEQNAVQRQTIVDNITMAESVIPSRAAEIIERKEYRVKVNSGISKLDMQLTEIKMRNKENENVQNKIEQIKKWIKLLRDNLLETTNSKGNYDADLTALEARLKDITAAVVALKEKLEIIESAKFVVSEEGVKSILVKKILQILNGKLAYYLKKMEANCIITFNEYFEEVIVNEKGKNCTYHNFSGAERKSIDLACLFTFMDIRRLQGDISINVSMYDELLDSSFDEKGVDLVLDILKERVDKYKEAVYIISHRRESVKHVTGSVIYIEKRGGISTRVAYTANE